MLHTQLQSEISFTDIFIVLCFITLLPYNFKGVVPLNTLLLPLSVGPRSAHVVLYKYTYS